MFFVVGLADGSVSSFNMSLWLGQDPPDHDSAGGGGPMPSNGQRGLAITLLSILAVPGVALVPCLCC